MPAQQGLTRSLWPEKAAQTLTHQHFLSTCCVPGLHGAPGPQHLGARKASRHQGLCGPGPRRGVAGRDATLFWWHRGTCGVSGQEEASSSVPGRAPVPPSASNLLSVPRRECHPLHQQTIWKLNESAAPSASGQSPGTGSWARSRRWRLLLKPLTYCVAFREDPAPLRVLFLPAQHSSLDSPPPGTRCATGSPMGV